MAFVLSEENYGMLKTDLDDFLENSEANAVLLCDRGGNIIVNSGDSVEGEADLISALVAGAFAATQQLASVLGEKEFTAIFHQGVKKSIFISAVGDEVLLLALFSDNTNAGLVKMYALTVCRKMMSLVRDVMADEEVPTDDPTRSFVLGKGPVFQADR
jgi:predicted regulator of Ras-like GTPase activity (Roadblock/LC7/MglB family)